MKYSFDLLHHVTDFLEAVAQKAIKLNFLAILTFDKKAFRWKMYEVNHFGSARHTMIKRCQE